MEKNEVRWSETECEDAEIVITAYGTLPGSPSPPLRRCAPRG